MDKPIVLVVDDDPIISEILAMNLEGEGYSVCQAHSGEKALFMVESINPDLVLLDVMMPGLDGWEVCGRIKSIPQFKDLPVILLTAMAAQDEDARRSKDLGAHDLVQKPFDPDQLMSLVRKTIQSYQNTN